MVEIKNAKQIDLDAVAAIESEAFSMPWSRQGFAEILDRENVLFLVAHATIFPKSEVDPERPHVLGYLCMYIALDEGEITNVAVAKDYRKKGVASALLHEAMARAKERGLQRIILEVRPSNVAALALYEHFGFALVGRRRHFYEKPREDALILELLC